jgi:hypothetical protein
MIGWGAYFQVSGLGHQEPGAGNQVQVRVAVNPPSVICHRFSHPSFQVPGDSPRGISLSGVGNQPSAVGFRLQRPPSEIS